jgi:hypothetical protein
MASPKKEPRPRSLRVTLFLGLLTLLLGAFLGVLSLATQKVEEVAEMPAPEARKPGVVYLLRGEDAPGARWRRKRNIILRGDPGEILFEEADLNDWARNQLKVVPSSTANKPAGADGGEGSVTRTEPEAPTDGEAAEAEGEGESWVPSWLQLEIIPSPPNFAFLEDQLQIVTYLEVPALGGRKFVYRAVGNFEKGEDELVRFVISEGSIGRAPLGNIPGANQQLNRLILSLFNESPEWNDLADPWKRIESIQIVEGELAMRVR